MEWLFVSTIYPSPTNVFLSVLQESNLPDEQLDDYF